MTASLPGTLRDPATECMRDSVSEEFDG